MAKTKVVWTSKARNDLDNIGDYIAKDSVTRAIDFTDRLFNSTVRLENFPLSGSICSEDATCRQVVLDGYRVIYEVTDRGVDVLTIISPGQNPTQLKEKV